jgi:hypothetical protein
VLSVLALQKSGKRPEEGKKFRLVELLVLPVGSTARQDLRSCADLPFEGFELSGRYYCPYYEEVPAPAISASTVEIRWHLFKGPFFSKETTSTIISLLHGTKPSSFVDLSLSLAN